MSFSQNVALVAITAALTGLLVPTVKAIRVPAPFTCYVSIEQRISGQAKNAILAVLGADLYMKRVVVVDHDIDIFNDRQVNWAIATRCRCPPESWCG